MKTILGILLLGAICSTQSLSPPKLEGPSITYEVCLSPGCVADGAQRTLETLQALAPPGCIVTPGKCCSLCGNGPVVMAPDEKRPKKHRRVKDSKILEILQEELGDENEDLGIPEFLIHGFQIYEDAEDAFLKEAYGEAATLYENAINVGLQPALELQAARIEQQCEALSESGIPFGLLWLVKARRHEALSKLAMGDIDGAYVAGQSSCELSENRSFESLEVLVEILNQKGDARGELEALTIYLDLPMDEKALSKTQIANKRRQLGFRRQKLQREVGEVAL